MTFTVIGGGGGVDSNRGGDSGRAAAISGTIVLNGQQQVTLKPGSAGQINGNAGRGTVPGGKAATNSLTSRPNGGDGRGGWAGGGGAASVLEVDGTVIVIAGGGGGTSQSLTASIGTTANYLYDGGNTRGAQVGAILQGNGYAGVPEAVNSVAAGNRGEGAFVRVSAHGNANYSASSNSQVPLPLHAVATGINGGVGGSSSGGAGGGVPDTGNYTFNGLYPNDQVFGASGGNGAGGNAPALLGTSSAPAAGGGGGGRFGGGAGGLAYGYAHVYRIGTSTPLTQGQFSTGTGSGGGGGSSWVSDIVVNLSADTEPNITTSGSTLYYGKHGLVTVTFSC